MAKKVTDTTEKVQNIQKFLHQRFPGREAFQEQILFPMFGGRENFEDGYNADLLKEREDVRKEAASAGITAIRRYGKFIVDFGAIYVFELGVTDRVCLAKNRVSVQKVIRHLLGPYSGAFMIFRYAENADVWDWRFSFCRKNATGDETAPKRYTFLLGPNQACRTAAQNFVNLTEYVKSHALTLDAIVSAFDVEAISSEFFRKYKAHYSDFVKYVTGKEFRKERGKWVEKDVGTSNEALYASFGHDDKRVRDYVKKLLGRIVFLHFLQKKGWLGGHGDDWTDGDPAFMLHLYERASDAQKEDFLDGVLEPLFTALDTRRTADEYDTGVDGIGKVKIPYLNGGLFTRNAADEIASRFPHEMFGGFLSFLAEYNFTIDENDPDDAEVGVDPEMLGRIFENLLEDNRDKGAYYTPKAIVEYMCRRSLAVYLVAGSKDVDAATVETFVATHDATAISAAVAERLLALLKSVRVCDPAIGSGAFPIGILRELRLLRIALGDSSSPASLTKSIIEDNIYGVDIEKGAVDIARLRFWLALVVDEDTPQALPNLDFKVMQGNSLLESYRGIDLSRLLPDAKGVARAAARPVQGVLPGLAPHRAVQQELAFGGETASAVIAERMREYYRTADRETKQKLMAEISEQVRGFVMASGLLPKEWHGELAALGPQNDRFFLWHTWFADVFANGGFDIVIGNPPYVQLSNNHGALGDLYKDSGFETFVKTGDLYCLFYEMGCRMLHPGGHLCYITSNKWMRTGYGEKLRGYLAKMTNPEVLLDFAGQKIFESATVDTNIILVQAGVANRGRTAACIGTTACRTDLGAFMRDNAVTCSFTSSDSWAILTPIERAIKAKMEKVGRPLKDWDIEINYGIKTGCNEAFIVNEERRKAILADCRDEDERRRTEQLIRPILRGRDVKRYAYEWANLYLIATHNGYGDTPRVKIEDYPAVKKWLDEGGIAYNGKLYLGYPQLEARADQGDTPYNLRNCAYMDDFDKPKIVWADLARTGNAFVYDENRFAVPNTSYVVASYDTEMLKYLLGVLNSKAILRYLDWISSKLDETGWRWIKQYVELLPVPVDSPERTSIADCVGRILDARKADTAADVSRIERQIDLLVYRLYGFTDEEVSELDRA